MSRPTPLVGPDADWPELFCIALFANSHFWLLAREDWNCVHATLYTLAETELFSLNKIHSPIVAPNPISPF
jgi:hypothetical protein